MQEIIVAAIVLSACWVVLKRYLPRAVRQEIARRMAALALRCACSGLAQRLQAASVKVSEKGGCSNCSACESGTPQAQAKTFSISPEALKDTIRR